MKPAEKEKALLVEALKRERQKKMEMEMRGIMIHQLGQPKVHGEKPAKSKWDKK